MCLDQQKFKLLGAERNEIFVNLSIDPITSLANSTETTARVIDRSILGQVSSHVVRNAISVIYMLILLRSIYRHDLSRATTDVDVRHKHQTPPPAMDPFPWRVVGELETSSLDQARLSILLHEEGNFSSRHNLP